MSLRTEERAPDPTKIREVTFLFDAQAGSFTPTVTLTTDSEGRVSLDAGEAEKLGRMFLQSAHAGWTLRMFSSVRRGTR